MDVKKFVHGASGALLLLCGNVYAQDGLEKAATNPFQKQLLVELENGTVAIADDSTQRIYMSTSSGQEFEVTFADAVAAAEPDPAKRPQVLQKFRASLTDTGHVIAVRNRRIATDASLWPRVEWCGNVICIEPWNSDRRSRPLGSQRVPDSQASSCNHYLCPQLPMPCDMGPCSPNKWGNGSQSFYSSSFAGWGADEGGGTVTQQQLVEYDKGLFESSRQDSCSEKNVVAASTSATGVATVAACILAETGVGAIGCAAGIVSYGIGLHQTNKKTKECLATYPGIGKW